MWIVFNWLTLRFCVSIIPLFLRVFKLCWIVFKCQKGKTVGTALRPLTMLLNQVCQHAEGIGILCPKCQKQKLGDEGNTNLFARWLSAEGQLLWENVLSYNR